MLKDRQRIESPNFPHEYLPERDCVWQVTAPERYRVALRFDFFDLEKHDTCQYDHLEIRDGMNSSSPLIANICGYNFPSVMRSKSTEMYIRFVADKTVQRIGFSATLTAELDHCKYKKHDCEHACVNTLSGYRCICNAGYQLSSDGKTCEGT